MAEVKQPPVKFVHPPNSHLICRICNRLFTEPVISVRCGHTFCRKCIFSESKDGIVAICPQDRVTCNLESLVVNRSVKAQIDDLDTYCRYGLHWSDIESDYISDPDGCTAHIKYSLRKQHEDTCEFAFVQCPNGGDLCGKLRKCKLAEHMSHCKHYPCQYKYKGCKYSSTLNNVGRHSVTCHFLSVEDHSLEPRTQIDSLLSDNSKLWKIVNSLSCRVKTLEDDKEKLSSQLEQYNRQLSELKNDQKKLSEQISKLIPTKPDKSTMVSNNKTDAVVSRDNYKKSSSVDAAVMLESWEMPFQFKCIGTFRSHKGGVWGLQIHNNFMFSAGEDNVIKVWNLKELARGCIHTMSGHEDKIQAMTVGKYLYSAGADMSIHAWNMTDFTEAIVRKAAHENIIAALECKDDFLFSSSHCVIKVWNAATLMPLRTISGLQHWVRCLVLGLDKKCLYSGSHNNIDIWDAQKDFNLKGKITHKYGSAYSLAVTERYIIVGTYNNNTLLFDVDKHNFLHKLSGHVGIIQSLAVTKSGQFLFTASSDATIQLWNLHNLLAIQCLSRHEASVNTVVLHNDLLISGSQDTEIKMFKYFKMQMGFTPS